MSTGLGRIQVELLRALATVEGVYPGRGATTSELVRMIFNSGSFNEPQRVTVQRALAKLEAQEKLVTKTASNRQWRISQGVIRLAIAIRPDGEAYLARIKRWLGGDVRVEPAKSRKR
jgi:hypothetical protein